MYIVKYPDYFLRSSKMYAAIRICILPLYSIKVVEIRID